MTLTVSEHDSHATIRDRLVALETRFDVLHPRVGVVEHKATLLEHRLDAIESRLGKIERALLAKGTLVLVTVEVVAGLIQHFSRQ